MDNDSLHNLLKYQNEPQNIFQKAAIKLFFQYLRMQETYRVARSRPYRQTSIPDIPFSGHLITDNIFRAESNSYKETYIEFMSSAIRLLSCNVYQISKCRVEYRQWRWDDGTFVLTGEYRNGGGGGGDLKGGR